MFFLAVLLVPLLCLVVLLGTERLEQGLADEETVVAELQTASSLRT